MMHVSILTLDDAVLSCIDGPRCLFQAMNEFLTATGKEPLFDVHLVGFSKDVPQHNGRYIIRTDALIDEIKKTDLVIIPAMSGDMEQAIEMNSKFIPWIIDQYNNGAEVASLCIGTFLLAATGLLKGKKCSTHWMHACSFRDMFPDVNLVDDRIVTEEQGLYTSAGANSFWNLLIYLIEKYAGRETAVFASKFFAIEIERSSQSRFVVFKGQKHHHDESVKKAQEFIENNYQEKITVDMLANMFALSRRNLERRFKKATSNTVAEYMQRVKMEVAKKSLETSVENVNEVMYKVGYNDPKAFRVTFKRITGLSPVQYRNKYSKITALLN